MDHKKHFYFLDSLRVFAIFSVVLIHTLEYVIPINKLGEIGISGQLLYHLLTLIGRLGVPIFLILSGFLLLPRDYDAEKTKTFYKKNLLGLIAVWECWIIIYNVFYYFNMKIDFSLGPYLKEALFLENIKLPHGWYMPMIIGLYLFIPPISHALKQTDKNLLSILMSIVFTVCFGLNFINLYLNDTPKLLESIVDFSFSGGVYGFYLLSGYILYNIFDKKAQFIEKNNWVLTTAIISFLSLTLLSVFLQLLLSEKNPEFCLWYNFILLPPLTFCLVIIFNRIKLGKNIKRILKKMAKATFGVYLIHILIIKYIIHACGFLNNKYLILLIATLLTFAGSFLLVEILSFIPRLNLLFLNQQNHIFQQEGNREKR